MRDLSEFQAIRDAVDVPILANMTEFAKANSSPSSSSKVSA